MKRVFNKEKGAVTIIEAAFVFPITFFIVFIMIMAGEAYYQNACVEYAVTTAAINGAARCENPMMKEVDHGGVPTNPQASDVIPYRYIFTGEAKRIATSVQADLNDTLEDMSPMLFKNMAPDNIALEIKPKMNPLISSFPVKCEFDVPLPIRLIFTTNSLSFHYTVNLTTSIGDPAEFLRNVALVRDMIDRSAAISEFCGKIKDGMAKIGQYIG